MAKLEFILEEDKSSTDVRANEFAYVLTIKNTGDKPVHLLSLQPGIPSDVTSVDVKNPTSEALKAKYDKTCKEIEIILNNNLRTFFKNIKKRIIDANSDVLNKVLETQGNSLFSLFKLMFRVVSGSYKASFAEQLDKISAYTVKIENSQQAQRAFDNWLTTEVPDEEKKFYLSKIHELLDIEDEMGADDIRSKSLATIESGSFFAQTYVFRFLRSKWEPRLYNISVTGIFANVNLDNQFTDSASTSLTITPDPIRLSVLAILSSFMGAVVKYCIDVKDVTLKFPYNLDRLSAALDSKITIDFFLNSLIGAISALVFFNIYERMDIGKKINVGVSWRSALLIGVVCGLFGERIIAALKALIA